MEIGEAIAVLKDTGGKLKCPFCETTATPSPAKKEMTNCATVLARHAGGMPSASTPNPESSEDYTIFAKYWLSDDESQIVMSPHHLLPGNASLARCPEILKWMAGTTSVTKKEEGATVMLALKRVLASVRRVAASRRKKKTDQLLAIALPPKPLKESPDGHVVFAYDGKKVESHSKPVTDNHVIGEITFDVNDKENCMWLPSHCAIADWSDVAGVDAWHCDQKVGAKPITFEVAYAYNTMGQTRVQFHDAHPIYSEEVIKELLKLDKALDKLAKRCLAHPGSPCKKKPFPAPEQLTAALYKLADLCARQLKVSKRKKPKSPWYTSDLALEVAKLI
jgi:hypothetical protein